MRQWFRRQFKARRSIVLGALFTVYLSLYYGTTTVRSGGNGGLTGPINVRVFKNEYHLVAFYPVYLVERWIRNGSLFDAVYYFNVDFEDRQYRWVFLYGDGVYSRIWYDVF